MLTQIFFSITRLAARGADVDAPIPAYVTRTWHERNNVYCWYHQFDSSSLNLKSKSIFYLDIHMISLVSSLVLWAQSTTEDYIRATMYTNKMKDNRFQSAWTKAFMSLVKCYWLKMQEILAKYVFVRNNSDISSFDRNRPLYLCVKVLWVLRHTFLYVLGERTDKPLQLY